jgi:hypothetical protein
MANLTDQQEAFARALFQGKSQADAYREAYPKSLKWKGNSLYREASVLASNPMVVGRVNELRAPVVAELQYGVKEAMAEALAAYELAMSINQPGAATQATTLRSKLNGLLIEKKEVVVTQMPGMSAADKELLREAAKGELARRKALSAPDDVQDVEPK